MQKIPVAISSCLLGLPLRYDGGHKYDEVLHQTLSDIFDFYPLCPEAGAGLGVPRPPVQLVRVRGQLRARGVERPELDVTQALVDYAMTQHATLQNIYGYIFKSRSPSCGLGDVDIFEAGTLVDKGSGLFARTIRQLEPALPVCSETQLHDPVARIRFVERVHNFYHARPCTISD